MTRRLVKYIQEQAVERKFADVAREVGVADNTVSGIFDDYIAYLDTQGALFRTPEYLGIDEIQIQGQMRCILTNVSERMVYDLLPSRLLEDIAPFLKSIPQSSKVKCVCMDMWKPYRIAVREVWGEELPVVIDHFHVVKLANAAVDTMRKSKSSSIDKDDRISLKRKHRLLLKRYSKLDDRGQSLISEWRTMYPDLMQVYDLKEQFYKIWDTSSRDEAEKRYQDWIESIPSELLSWFKPLIRAVDNWHSEVFAYFDHPITNAYTEAMNRIINIMSRLGPAYSFETIRGKLRYSKKNLSLLTELGKLRTALAIAEENLLPYEELAKISFGPSISHITENLSGQVNLLPETNPYAEFGLTQAQLAKYADETEELWDVDLSTILKHTRLKA